MLQSPRSPLKEETKEEVQEVYRRRRYSTTTCRIPNTERERHWGERRSILYTSVTK